MNRRDILTSGLLGGTAAVVATAASAQQSAAPESTLEQIRRSGVFRSAVIVGQEPYFHKDLTTDEWSGACVDMAKDIASKLNVKTEFVESTWGNVILDLQSNKIDAAFSMQPTPERALAVDFTSPIFYHTFTIVTRNGFDAPATWEALSNPSIKIAVDVGSSHEFIARRYAPKAEILAFKTRDEAVMAVAAGRADCTVVLTILALATLKKNPALGTLVVPQPLLTLPSNIMIRYDADKRFRDFLSTWADYNRAMGQSREWLLNGFSAIGITAEDIPAELQF